MTPFSIAAPPRILFGRGEAGKAAPLIAAFGPRGVLVHGAHLRRAAWLVDGLVGQGVQVQTLSCPGEPTLAMVEQAVAALRPSRPAWVVALGGGAVIDMGKALAALIPAPGGAMDHLEVVGKGLALTVDPLPFVALPTTAGTGAEVTKNAVIGLPELGRKVSLRDDRMIARLAIVDPALTDLCPRGVTLASGLDAITQVIEPYVSARANPFTDALAVPAIEAGLPALMRLMQAERPADRDTMAWVSLCGGLALANAGLGAVHGLAGVIGGMTAASHGSICGALLPHVLTANRRAAAPDSRAALRLDWVCRTLGAALGVDAQAAPQALAAWARGAGLPGLTAQGLRPADHAVTAAAALTSSSMKGNPVSLPVEALRAVLGAAG